MTDAATTKIDYPATGPQAGYILALTKKHACSDQFVARVTDALDGGTADEPSERTMDKIKASEVISWLMKQPLRAATISATTTAAAVAAAVPAGYYAVESATGNNDLDFYRVDVPETGKYVGRVFVKRIVGGHPEFNIHSSQTPAVLDRIMAAGVDAAATKYGTEIGRCYRCNRILTDDLSRSLGIGPHCRA